MLEFNLLASCFILIPAVVAGILFRSTPALQGFSLYLFTAVLFEAAFVYTGLKRLNNWWLLDFYCLTEYILLGSWLVNSLAFSKWRKLKWSVFAGLGAIILWLTLYKQDFTLPHVNFQNVVLLILSGLALVFLLKQDFNYALTSDSRFWIFGGIFIRFSCLFLIFTLTTFLQHSDESVNGMYFIYLLSSVNLLTYVLFIIAYLCKYPHRLLPR